jgi:hypothetical protein
MTVDSVVRLFPFSSPPYNRLVTEFRQRIFEEYAATDERGRIFTFVWALDEAGDRQFILRAVRTFREQGSDVCFVELQATQEERRRRNETPLRRAEKWRQSDLDGSRTFIVAADERYQLNTRGDFLFSD